MKRRLRKERIVALILSVVSFIKMNYDIITIPENIGPSWLTVICALVFSATGIYLILQYEFDKDNANLQNK